MIDKQIVFRIFKRPNRFEKNGTEWAMNAQIVGHDSWTLKTWDNKPTDKMIEDAKITILRAFEFYHKNLQIPPYEMYVAGITVNDDR